MKIKTITCHNVYNTGASLQAYALSEYLRSLGHDVEIIDYIPEYLRHYKLTGVNNQAYNKPFLRMAYNIAKLPGRLRARYGHRKKAFDQFTDQYLSLTKRHYTSIEELKENPPEADVIFAGSDQIWNTFFQNGRDPSFYLQFASKGCVRASYAASFATETIAEEWKPIIKKWLSEMDYISVRESSGIEIVRDLDISGAVQVVDPVFLLSKEKWEAMVDNPNIAKPYILVYDFDKRRDIADFAKEIAEKNGWKVYSFLSNPYISENFGQEGPEMFLSLIKNAELIVSNSFHATAFSLIFEKQFVVFLRNEDINTRMKDLLELVGLSDCLMSNERKIMKEIDFSEVRLLLRQRVKASKTYITDVLRDIERK